MANGAVLLKWRDRNWAEHGHYVYRSTTPMDINNLPSPIGTLLPNQYEYIDYDVIADQTYYYRIGAFRNNDVSVSNEIEVVAAPSNTGPGPVDFIGGDESHGFYGEVPSSEFITGDALASAIGLTAGVSQFSDTPWLKYSLNDEIIFIPKKPIRHSVSWENIYQAGAVYGTNDFGLNPYGGNRTQDAMVTIDGFDFKVTLLKGANVDPAPNTTGFDVAWTHDSEWNKLLYPVHSGVHTESSNPSNPSEPYNQWASYSDDDLLVHRDFGTGSYCWTQERHSGDATFRVFRGTYGVSYANRSNVSSANSYVGFRPALRLAR